MKKVRITTIMVLAFLSLTVMSCKEGKKENTQGNTTHSEMNHDNTDGHHDADKEKEERTITSKTEQNADASAIIDAYLKLKNGLVADSQEQAVKGAEAMLAAFSNFEMGKLTGGVHKEYMEIYESAKEHAEHIVKSDINHQREHFEGLSTDITDMVTLLGTSKTLYQDFCPMANNNKGAYWLSEVKEIKNPYFGAKMLSCGKVEKQIN